MSKTKPSDGKRQNSYKQRNQVDSGHSVTSPSKTPVKVAPNLHSNGKTGAESAGVNTAIITTSTANGSLLGPKGKGVSVISDITKQDSANTPSLANGNMRPMGEQGKSHDDGKARKPTSRLLAMKNRLRNVQKKKEEKNRERKLTKSKSVQEEVPVTDFRPYIRQLQRSVTEGSLQHDPDCQYYHHRSKSQPDRTESHYSDPRANDLRANDFRSVTGSQDSLASRASSISSNRSEGTLRRGIKGFLMKRSRTFEGNTNLQKIPEDSENSNANVHYQIYQRLVDIQAADARLASRGQHVLQGQISKGQELGQGQHRDHSRGHPNQNNQVSGRERGGGGLRVTNPADSAHRRQPSRHHNHVNGYPRHQTLTGHHHGRQHQDLASNQPASLPDTPRRHTVTIGGMDLELGNTPQQSHKFERQREAFLDHLARKYPQHANTIQSRDGPLYGRLGPPKKTGNQAEKDGAGGQDVDAGRMIPETGQPLGVHQAGTFQRGTVLRASLPIVRSPNKTTEKPLGLVFLIYRNETKRALLPNEVTSVDTVRALFVRSFPEILNMAYLDSPHRKIYVLDQQTNLYYELEDLKDVKDRAVLKIYETDAARSDGSRSPSRSPKSVHSNRASYISSGHESDSSTRSAPPGLSGMPRSPVHGPVSQRPFSHDFSTKSSSLPVQPTYAYQQQMLQHQYGTHYGSAGPPLNGDSPTHQLRGQPSSNQSSPQRNPPNSLGGTQRHSVAYLPEPANFTQTGIPQSRSYHDYYDGSSRSGSATPTASDMETRSSSSPRPGSRSSGRSPHHSLSRMDKMEVQLMNLAALVQTAVTRDGSRPGSARSSTSINSNTNSAHSSQDGSGEGPPTSESLTDSLTNSQTHGSIEALNVGSESQSDSTTPVVTSPGSAHTGLSDLSSATPQPTFSLDMQNSLKTLKGRARELRDECRHIRRLQIAFAENMRDTINETYRKIKEVIPGVPGASELPVRSQRLKASQQLGHYRDDSSRIENDLKDLEKTVEDLRNDVLHKRCRVNMSEVEVMALALSNISKNLADLKANFPQIQDTMKTVMSGEMEVVVQEERFLKDEPQRLENALKRCKKLTGTLYTLKRLSTVQEERAPTAPVLPVNGDLKDETRKNVLDDIQAMIPNHEARVHSLEAAEEAIERKKKLVTSADTLRFEKSLELAHRQLRETNGDARQVNGILKQQGALDEEGQKVNLPLTTDTTRRLTQVASPEKERKEVKGEGTPPPPKPPRTQAQLDSPPSGTVIYSTAIMKNGDTTYTNPHSSSPSSPTKFPTPLTSTPISNSNSIGRSVTFSNVVEIRDSSATTRTFNDVDGKRKIPPPPPPRRSSRLVSPQEGPQTGRSFSPPAYENIENLNVDTNGDSKTDKSRPRPLNKFQHDLAAGIYANLNRPDLQGQRTSPSAVVRDPGVRDNTANNVSSDSDSTCSQDSQPSRNKDGVVLREKKTPPPPPVRRTSALSNIQKQTIPEDEPPSPRDNTLERPVSNGEVKTDTVQSIVTRFNSSGPNMAARSKTLPHPSKSIHHTRTLPKNKNYEETEIY